LQSVKLEVNLPGSSDPRAIDGLYSDLAHAIYNGPNIPHATPIYVSSTTFDRILTAVNAAYADALKGIDPTAGADEYNNRYGAKKDMSPRIFINTTGKRTGTLPVIRIDGPFTRQIGRGRHVKTQTFLETFERSTDPVGR
jgi:hypothetical protein